MSLVFRPKAIDIEIQQKERCVVSCILNGKWLFGCSHSRGRLAVVRFAMRHCRRHRSTNAVRAMFPLLMPPLRFTSSLLYQPHTLSHVCLILPYLLGPPLSVRMGRGWDSAVCHGVVPLFVYEWSCFWCTTGTASVTSTMGRPWRRPCCRSQLSRTGASNTRGVTAGPGSR